MAVSFFIKHGPSILKDWFLPVPEELETALTQLDHPKWAQLIQTGVSKLLELNEWDLAVRPDQRDRFTQTHRKYFNYFKDRVTRLSFYPFYCLKESWHHRMERVALVIASLPQVRSICILPWSGESVITKFNQEASVNFFRSVLSLKPAGQPQIEEVILEDMNACRMETLEAIFSQRTDFKSFHFSGWNMAATKQAPEAVFKELNRLDPSTLREFSLSDAHLTDEQLCLFLKNHPNIETLSLLNLRDSSLKRRLLSRELISQISQLPHLTKLNLSSTGRGGEEDMIVYDDTQAEQVGDPLYSCKNLRSITLNGQWGFAALSKMAQALPALEELHMDYCGVGRGTIDALEGTYPSVVDLSIRWQNSDFRALNADRIKKLAKVFPSLEKLNLENFEFDLIDIPAFSEFKKLKFLRVGFPNRYVRGEDLWKYIQPEAAFEKLKIQVQYTLPKRQVTLEELRQSRPSLSSSRTGHPIHF